MIIEQTKQETMETDNEIQKIKDELKSRIDTDNLLRMERTLREELSSFESTLKAYKIKKYERDADDYKNGKVYTWMNEQRDKRMHYPTQIRRERQGRRDHLTSETSDQEMGDRGRTSESSADERFLGPTGHPPLPFPRGRGRGRGGGRGKYKHPPPPHKMTTRSLNNR